jgi:hypothetical protein
MAESYPDSLMSAMQAALGASGRPWSLFAFAHACFLPVHSLGSGPLLLIWSAGRIGVVELGVPAAGAPGQLADQRKKYKSEWLAAMAEQAPSSGGV